MFHCAPHKGCVQFTFYTEGSPFTLREEAFIVIVEEVSEYEEALLHSFVINK